MSLGHVTECHMWNFTRDPDDEMWLRNGGARSHLKFEVKEPRDKSRWNEYYDYYQRTLDADDVLVKLDDDILFIDVEQFPRFIEHRRQSQHVLLFGNTLNNSVCNYYQVKYGLHGVDVGYVPAYGPLWESGTIANRLHGQFLADPVGMVARARDLPVIPHTRGDRISINCFAILGRDAHHLDIVQAADDEHELTVVLTQTRDVQHGIDMSFLVCHGAFYRQRETGLDERDVQTRYLRLARESPWGES